MSSPIVYITKSPKNYDDITVTLKKMNRDYPVYVNPSPDACIAYAKEQVALGTKVIVSTAFLQEKIMSQLNVMTVNLRRSGYSFISAIHTLLKRTDKIAIVCRGFGYDYGVAAAEARSIWPDNIIIKFYGDEPIAYKVFEELKEEGYSEIICPSQLEEIALQYGMNPTLIHIPEKDIVESVRHAEHEVQVYMNQLRSGQILEKVLNLVSEGIIVLGPDGVVMDCNDNAGAVLGVPRSGLLGARAEDNSLSVFNIAHHLEKQEDVHGAVAEIDGEMIIYDIHCQFANRLLTSIVITFNRVDQIMEAEHQLRHKINGGGNTASKTFSSIVGGSEAITRVIKQAKRYAQFNAAVLITAPSGCGKELFAQSIHNASPRADKPFVVINCAALPESVLESLLFGYESGSFTGAVKGGKPGLFEQAHGGTVFLDEVSEMPISIQSRILRVLQEKEVSRIGSSKSIPVDVRVLSATNRDMWELIDKKAFREDLYHRISTLVLDIPPLNDRPEDIPPLSQFFVKTQAQKLGLDINGIEPQALEYLSRQSFSGNVRQLNNILERALILSASPVLTLQDVTEALRTGLRPSLTHEVAKTPTVLDLSEFTYNSEREIIKQALSKHEHNRTKAASELGISTTTLWRKMKAYNILEE